MQILPHPQWLGQALAAREPAPISQRTLAELDADEDFGPLDDLISQQAGPYCSSIKFYDDDQEARPRALLYEVRIEVYTGYFDRDEDGPYADTESVREIIRIDVHPEMTVDQIAQAALEAIQSISNNRFA